MKFSRTIIETEILNIMKIQLIVKIMIIFIITKMYRHTKNNRY